jgi:hypothetical protein
MRNGLKLIQDDESGRTEIDDPTEYAEFSVKLSDETIEELESLEEFALMAEQRLGMLIVG